MKNLQKGFIMPALLVLIALLVIGGGIYIYQNKKAQAPAVVDTGIQAGYLTYTNKDLGIAFDYPPTYKIYQTDDKTLRVTADYNNPQMPYADIAIKIERRTTTRETTEQVEARFKPNITAETPVDIRNKLSSQTSSSQNKGNYTLFRVEDGLIGKYFFLQSDKGTFQINLVEAAGKIDYQNYENKFNQIIDSIKIN